MKAIISSFLTCALALCIVSCSQPSNTLTEADKTAAADSARALVQKLIDLSNKMDFKGAGALFTTDPDGRFIENGVLYPSLAEMLATYEQMSGMLELLENKIDSWNVVVLSKDAVSITLPLHFRIKAKGLPEYNGTYLWSGITQIRNGKWVLVQTHESWLNFAEAMAALTPPESK